MTSTLPPLVQACSGALGSAVANSLVYPLDLITTRLQLATPRSVSKDFEKPTTEKAVHPALPILRRILRKYGYSALYDGVWADTGATLLSNFFYFYFYSFLRKKYTAISARRGGKTGGSLQAASFSALEELLLGFVAGVASRAISTPLNIVTVRLQTERQSEDSEDELEGKHAEDNKGSGLVAALKKIYKEHGLAGFWRGFTTTTILSLNPSITMTFFQFFRRFLALFQHRIEAQANPNPGEAFVGAAVSNAIATILLYPLILAKTIAQSSNASSSPRLRNALTAQGRGGRGAYQGLDMQLLKGCVSQGVTFLVKGRIEEMIVGAYLRRIGSAR